MPRISNQLPESLSQWLENWLLTQKFPTNVEITPLAGDGSTRTFFRLSWDGESRVLLSDPEWIFSKDYPVHQHYLAQCKIPVPRFFGWDAKAGGLVMEDLGDELLQFRLKKEPGSKTAWLTRAITLLARLHGATFPVPKELPVSSRKFDTAKYTEEFKFTLEHLSQKFLGLPPPDTGFLKTIEAFCRELEKIQPEVFVHRDYHTRNLLIHKEDLYVIDFQDARLGPPHYDVASLLYDAYVPISETEKAELTQAYKTELSKFPKLYEKIEWGTWDESIKLVAYQRTIKAAGSFASFFTRFGKSTHLPYLLPALESAKKLVGNRQAIFPLDLWIEKIKSRP